MAKKIKAPQPKLDEKARRAIQAARGIIKEIEFGANRLKTIKDLARSILHAYELRE